MIKDEDKFAYTVKMGTKGQIVIPNEARKVFGFKPGDTILLLGDINKGLAIVKPNEFDAVFNMIVNKNKN